MACAGPANGFAFRPNNSRAGKVGSLGLTSGASDVASSVPGGVGSGELASSASAILPLISSAKRSQRKRTAIISSLLRGFSWRYLPGADRRQRELAGDTLPRVAHAVQA